MLLTCCYIFYLSDIHLLTARLVPRAAESRFEGRRLLLQRFDERLRQGNPMATGAEPLGGHANAGAGGQRGEPPE